MAATAKARAGAPASAAPPLTEKRKDELLRMRSTERFKSTGFYVMPKGLMRRHAGKFSGAAQKTAVEAILEEQCGSPANVPPWVLISTRQLERDSNGEMTAKAYDVALADAAERGLIERQKRGREWWYRCFPENWHLVKPYQHRVIEMPKPTAVEPRPEPPRAAQEPAVLLSGKASQPVSVPVEVALTNPEKPDESVNTAALIQVRHYNVTKSPLSIRTTFEKGALLVTVEDPEASDGGEQKVGGCGTEGGKKPRSELKAALRDLFERHLERPLVLDDNPLIDRIARALREAPIGEFVQYCESEIAGMRKRRKPVTAALFPDLAAQASRRWQAGAAAREARARQIARLRAAGFESEAAAERQIERWQAARHDVEAEIRKAEQWHSEDAETEELPE